MSRGGHSGGPHSLRHYADLTGLISIAERNDLTTLISAITEKMHNDISVIFDSPPVSPVSSAFSQPDHHHWFSLAIFRCHDANKENMLPSPVVAGDGSKTYSKAHHIVEKEEAEAMTPQLRELRKEALLFFRKWQNALIQRTREIQINETLDAPPNLRSRGGRVPRASICGRGSRGGAANGCLSLTLAIGPPRAPTDPMDRIIFEAYPPIPNTLWLLALAKRKLLLRVATLLTLSLHEYNANARVFLLHLTSCLNLTLDIFQADEMRLSQALAKAALECAVRQDLVPKSDEKQTSRRSKLGISTSCSPNANLMTCLQSQGIGATDNEAALSPSSVAGLLGPMANHGHLLSNLFGINPVRPTAKMLDSCCRDIPDFAFLRLHDGTHSEHREARDTSAERRRLRVVIAMSGCFNHYEGVYKPWTGLGRDTEIFAVRWDVSALIGLADALETAIKSTAWSCARKEILSRSIFSCLVESSWPFSLHKISKIIDNPWNMRMVRAEKAGIILTDAIIRHKFQGERSVFLVGYSLASRAIYTCLMVLAERRQFGLIDSVVMMGTPAPSESRVWLTLKSVVTGRLVNVYSEHDVILGFLYRTSNVLFGVAGLQAIQGAQGVENHCVGKLQRGHLDYQDMAGSILIDIGWETLGVKPPRRHQDAKVCEDGRHNGCPRIAKPDDNSSQSKNDAGTPVPVAREAKPRQRKRTAPRKALSAK